MCERFGVGQQDRRRVGPVLCLPEQVGGAQLAVDRVVGDDECLGGACQ